MIRSFALCARVARCGFLLALCVVSLAVSARASAADDIAGFWLTQDHDGVIEIYPCGAEICGRFHWLKVDGDKIPRDTENDDPAKRNRPLCHMQFMSGFKPNGKKRYEDGSIYNPEDGLIYSALMTLKDHNTLDLHGYVIHPLFGQSQIWTRTGAQPECSETDK